MYCTAICRSQLRQRVITRPRPLTLAHLPIQGTLGAPQDAYLRGAKRTRDVNEMRELGGLLDIKTPYPNAWQRSVPGRQSFAATSIWNSMELAVGAEAALLVPLRVPFKGPSDLALAFPSPPSPRA